MSNSELKLRGMYFDTLNLPNIKPSDLTQSPIIKFTRKAIPTTGGHQSKFNVVVLVTLEISHIDINGILEELSGYEYLGMVIAKFLNMFFIHRLDTPSAVGKLSNSHCESCFLNNLC
ncbi:hypothetical protein J3R30DRAFT_3478900 [Lentinula aciculospora]|uniref:Uncharacterized protein n=1 Tax=Lentinula aciculospora TaxID=153920 RepID=A0A9W9DMP3_9AGAR|nr:hypothetical protein J3R30DRAFT_3478900 [Lentinula aciculospora]